MTRPLGLYERFSLARTLIGAAPIVVLLATLPAGAKELGRADLELAEAEVRRKYPLMSCRVVQAHTREPSFAEMEEDDWRTAVEVRDGVLDDQDDAELLKRALEEGKSIDVERGPLWKAVLVNPGGEARARQRVLLTTHHVVSDGSGARNLFAELLTLLQSPPSSISTQTATTNLAPSQESTINLKPSFAHLAGVVFAEMVAPRLPAFLRPSPAPTCWPNPIASPPLANPTALKLLTLPSSSVAALKALAKAHGIRTLQPLLHTAAVSALALALSSISTSFDAPLPPLAICTPLSLRSTELGHPSATCNYVASLDSLSPSVPGLLSTPFFAACRTYAAQLTDPAELVKAKGNLGMLAFVPDSPVAEGEKTGFESFWQGKADGSSPFSASLELSNLGLMPATGWEASAELSAVGQGLEVCWAQTASVIGAALTLNAVSVKDGRLAITLTWRQDTIDDKVVNEFWDTFAGVLETLARGEFGAEVKVGQLLH